MGILLSIRADVRDAVRSPSDENINAASRNATIEPSTQSVIARYDPKCKFNVIANVLIVRNLTSAMSVSQYAPVAHIYRTQYIRDILRRIQTDVFPSIYRPPNYSTGRVYIQRQSHSGWQLIEDAWPIEILPRSFLRISGKSRMGFAL